MSARETDFQEKLEENMNKPDLWTAIMAVTILVLAATGLALIGGQSAFTALLANEGFRAIALLGMIALALVLIFVGAIMEMMAKKNPPAPTPVDEN